ncbi:MAG: PhoX family phosphatase [Bryobacteraceae bacterium]|nr:PhoX family phosphatase [Bryobacteraceae bacterium]
MSTFEQVIKNRFNRRTLLGQAAKAIPVASFAAAMRSTAAETDVAGTASASVRDAGSDPRLSFTAIPAASRDGFTVATGYRSDVILRWGDPLFNDSPQFDPATMTAAAQAKQFGYNCDWMDFFPLPGHDVANPRHGLLVVNHEYTNPELMFKNYGGFNNQTREQTDIELMAHGLSVVELMRDSSGRWRYVQGSQYNRRITMRTMFEITGPAAGSPWLRTTTDAEGKLVEGTLNNCAGGISPWGTALSGEENFHQYFSNASALPDGPLKTLHARYGLPNGNGEYPWSRHYSRFDVGKEPNEPNRFGWIVEFDPYDPASRPKKRTALGRIRHEGATIEVARNGRIVAYMGDDERFQHVYKYVSKGTFNAFNRAANSSLLDEGTLYTAKFNDDGSGQWLPLVYGQGPLTTANGFTSQADVLINTRTAARLLGATQMDRPEDIDTNPVNGKVYIALTNNTNRTDRQVDKANPRASNRYGHIIELTEDGGDHTALQFRWEIFLLCGDGKTASHGAFFAGFDPAQVSAIANPDNLAFDNKGNLWISTDGQPGTLRINDGIYAVPTEGPERGFVRQLCSVAIGAEAASLVMNTDDTALFVAVQHPGEGGKWTDTASDSISSFPDGKQPVRPSVVVVSKASGSPVIGS